MTPPILARRMRVAALRFAGQSCSEIASELGLPLSTVHTDLWMARRLGLDVPPRPRGRGRCPNVAEKYAQAAQAVAAGLSYAEAAQALGMPRGSLSTAVRQHRLRQQSEAKA